MLTTKELTGMDTYGFSALLAGERRPENNNFSGIGNSAAFWSSSEWSSGYSHCMLLDSFYFGLNVTSNNQTYGYSVRCVQDMN